MCELGLKELSEILPHQSGMLLLDEIKINREEAKGKLTVREESCRGHIIDGRPVLRGSDLLDMAAQLLAVYTYINYPELRERVCVVREYGKAKLKGIIVPGNVISITLGPESVIRTGKGNFDIISGNDFVVRGIEGEMKAQIDSVVLVVSM